MKRIITTILVALSALLIIPAGAQASGWHRVHLRATAHERVWRSPQVGRRNQAVSYGVYVKGQEVNNLHGFTDSDCRGSLIMRHLGAQVESCGAAPVTIRYIGSTRFTLVYRFG